MATLLENAVRRTSVFQLSLFVAVLAVMPPTAKTFGQEDHQQQPVNQRQQEKEQKTQKPVQDTSGLTGSNGSAPSNAGSVPAAPAAATGQPEQITHEKSPVSAGWIAVFLCAVAAIGLVLFCLLAGAGAGATVMALLWNAPEKHPGPARHTHPSWRAANHSQRWTFKAERFIRLYFGPASWNPLPVVGAVSRGTKARLVRFVPSRRTALRLACFALGIALMAISGFWFVKGESLTIGFVLLVCGYLIVVAAWVWPLYRSLATSNTVKERPRKQEQGPEKDLPTTVVTVEQSRVDQELVAPAAHLGFSTSTYWHSVDCEQSQPKQKPLEFTRRLRCRKCNTQYNVKGKGTLAARHIPCPKCGAPLQRAGGAPPKFEPQEPGWVPIISVLCKQCCRLIDVPYASIGKLISCPRCYADLPVPDTEL
jgi:hypothetical protein